MLSQASAVDSISIDDFKKIPNEAERTRLINQASPEEKKKLMKVERHLRLLGLYGGEAGLKFEKESQTSKARGLGSLEDVFQQQRMIWETYVGNVSTAKESTGMTPEKIADIEKHLMEEKQVIDKRLPVVHSLVFNTAASSQALELEKRAEKLSALGTSLSTQTILSGNATITVSHPITRAERREFDKQANQIFEEMQKLPMLPPGEAQKEYNEFPEEKMQATFM